jgi:hypothetical protein
MKRKKLGDIGYINLITNEYISYITLGFIINGLITKTYTFMLSFNDQSIIKDINVKEQTNSNN